MQILSREKGRKHTDNIRILDRDECVFFHKGEGWKENRGKIKNKTQEQWR